MKINCKSNMGKIVVKLTFYLLENIQMEAITVGKLQTSWKEICEGLMKN